MTLGMHVYGLIATKHQLMNFMLTLSLCIASHFLHGCSTATAQFYYFDTINVYRSSYMRAFTALSCKPIDLVFNLSIYTVVFDQKAILPVSKLKQSVALATS